ncbi:A24 family peptidase [Pectobacterium polonicum]|uniref:A24 family peptidase n=1 Tax=Pectobacterium polonicum TaxID=2485124 RepID=A0AAE9T0E6_9GAMM|nr:A24 family peptidase [Pectobacterium polonicum]UVO09275.1 A24 family peptidase [Pectobacterium polonicum]
MIFQFNDFTPWSPFIFVGLFVVFSYLLNQPRQYLADRGERVSWNEYIARFFVAVYAVVGVLIFLSPLSLFERMSLLLFLGFMLQLSVIDALSGWLPIEYTRAASLAGMVATLGRGDMDAFVVLGAMAAMAGIGILFAVARFYFNLRAQRDVLGLGDVWLSVAIAAWCGWSDTLLALMMGVMGFVIWHACSRCQRKEGPLGPWLCAGTLLVLINRVFNPVVVW